MSVHIRVNAYGETHLNRTYDPCEENVASLCPMDADKAVESFIAFPVTPSIVASIPSIAYHIPDLEALVRLQIFSNSTGDEILCVQAAMTNGLTLAQPAKIGVTLGVVTFVAALASFTTLIFGNDMIDVRMHYAHSFSVLLILDTFQSIFLTGMISVDWPAILPAWWSNFAWTMCLFTNKGMLNFVNTWIGRNATTHHLARDQLVDITQSTRLAEQIYDPPITNKSSLTITNITTIPFQRAEYNASNPYDYPWFGHQRRSGLPLAGTWPGFNGTLSAINLPSMDAATVSFIWWAAIGVSIVLFVAMVKVTLEVASKIRCFRKQTFGRFRRHYLSYIGLVLLRLTIIAYPALITLSAYEFTLDHASVPTFIGAVLFVFLTVALLAGVAFAGRHRYPMQNQDMNSRTYQWIPDYWVGGNFKRPARGVRVIDTDLNLDNVEAPTVARFPGWHTKKGWRANKKSVHTNESFVGEYGWLTGRYRSRRWWFGGLYILYQFFRGCVFGAGNGKPNEQVYILLTFEIAFFGTSIWLNPFESNRNTVFAVWLGCICKLISVGLCIAFLPGTRRDPIISTIIGFVIVITQGCLAASALALVGTSIVSSGMSMLRFTGAPPKAVVSYYQHIQLRTIKTDGKCNKKKEPDEVRQETKDEENNLGEEDNLDYIVKWSGLLGDLSAQGTPEGPEEDRVSMGEGPGINITSFEHRGNLPFAAQLLQPSWHSNGYPRRDVESSRMGLWKTLRVQDKLLTSSSTVVPNRPDSSSALASETRPNGSDTSIAWRSEVTLKTAARSSPSAPSAKGSLLSADEELALSDGPVAAKTTTAAEEMEKHEGETTEERNADDEVLLCSSNTETQLEDLEWGVTSMVPD